MADARGRQVTEWVQRYGDLNQQYRYELGLLPLDEVLAEMRAAAFAPLDGLEAPATIEAIRTRIEASAMAQLSPVVTLREHAGECEHGRVVRRSVRVEVTFGEFFFAREYACPQSAS